MERERRAELTRSQVAQFPRFLRASGRARHSRGILTPVALSPAQLGRSSVPMFQTLAFCGKFRARDFSHHDNHACTSVAILVAFLVVMVNSILFWKHEMAYSSGACT